MNTARACDGSLALHFHQAHLTLRLDEKHGAKAVATLLECAERAGFNILHRELDTDFCNVGGEFPATTKPTIAAFTLLRTKHHADSTP